MAGAWPDCRPTASSGAAPRAPVRSGTVETFVKRRPVPAPGSIPAALDMFRNEVRFYREIAPIVGVRVPKCVEAEDRPDGTLLALEDLSAWSPGADPTQTAGVLRRMHDRWVGDASAIGWLRRIGAGADLVTDLFERTAPALTRRDDLSGGLRALVGRLRGTVVDVEAATAGAGPLTLVHGDASTANMRTAPDGTIALLDWEDVSRAPGACDLAWLLVSSVDPGSWEDVVSAYGSDAGLRIALPAAAVQGFLTLAGEPDGSATATGWISRLKMAVQHLAG